MSNYKTKQIYTECNEPEDTMSKGGRVNTSYLRLKYAFEHFAELEACMARNKHLSVVECKKKLGWST